MQYSRTHAAAFTIVELLIVMAIILVLAGLILGTSGYVQKKGARSRAEAEIAAFSAALESYKADNGIYPGATNSPAPPSDSDNLNARADFNPAGSMPNNYSRASLLLYSALSGDENRNGQVDANEAGKPYFPFKPQMLGGTKDASGNLTAVSHVRDPFGNSYGYSTANQRDLTKGYNPTFDLWSTAGETGAGAEAQWIKNW